MFGLGIYLIKNSFEIEHRSLKTNHFKSLVWTHQILNQELDQVFNELQLGTEKQPLDVKQLENKFGVLAWAEISPGSKTNHRFLSQEWKQSAFESYLNLILPKLNFNVMKEKGFQILRIKIDPLTLSEWLVYGFFSKDKQKVHLFILDPLKTFSFLKKWGQQASALGMRVFIVGGDGVVIAHSQSHYIGSEFHLPHLTQVGANEKEEFRSIDQNHVMAVYGKFEDTPLITGVEQITEAGLRWAWFNKTGALLLFVATFLCLIFYALRKIRLIKKPKQIEVDFNVPENDLESIRILEENSGVSRAVEKLQASQYAVQSIQTENHWVHEFEKNAAQKKDLKSISKNLVDIASKLAQSPCLFFGYREEVSAAILQFDAGFHSGNAPAAMSFVVQSEALKAIGEAQQKGGVFSLSQYPPLAAILLAKTGVAHFEAWPITGFGPLGRASGKVRLIGVLVILQAGTQSVLHNDSLQRMIRSTGLIYENTLLSTGV